MLAYLARTVPVVARATLRRDGRLTSRIVRRVGPRELDLNLHMNQAAYAQAFELGRTDWVVRSGAWARFRAEGIGAVVAEQRIVYRRELRLGTRYEILSRAVRIDGRLLRFEGHLVVGERVHAKNEAALLFVGPEGVLGAEPVAALCADFVAEPLGVVDWRLERP
ncbi:MAG: thioesterase family protein [Myxococcota bacterium]